MTVFAIAAVSSVCAGHGDYYDEIAIRPIGAYGSDGLPPVFTSRESAEQWISANKTRLHGTVKIVEMEVS